MEKHQREIKPRMVKDGENEQWLIIHYKVTQRFRLKISKMYKLRRNSFKILSMNQEPILTY